MAGGSARLNDLWRFNPAALSWREVRQSGAGPERPWSSPNGFDKMALHPCGTLLAFGEPQDENRDPSSAKRPPAGSTPLGLHALDLCTGTWSELPMAAGSSPGFDHIEALLLVNDRLVALGWQTPRAGRKDDTPMQVATLEVSTALRSMRGDGGGGTAACWSKLTTRGHMPTARAGCACALLRNSGGCPTLLMHGGMLTSPSVQGLLTSDAYSLELDTCTWTKLAPTTSRAFGQQVVGQPRINHCAVSESRSGGVLLLGGTGSIGAFASVPLALELLYQPSASSAQPARNHHHQLPALLAAVTSTTGAAPHLPGTAGAGNSDSLMKQQTAASAVVCAAPALAPCHDLRPFFLSEMMSDAALVAGDTVLPAHRIVLAVSPRFRQVGVSR